MIIVENIKETVRFWWMIIREAVPAAVLFSEVRGGMNEIIKGLVINIVSFFGIGAFQGFNFRGAISWLVLLIILRFVWFLIYLPSKFYAEKRTEAYRLTWADVSINEFTFPKESGLGVGLKIISKKRSQDCIDNMRAEIDTVRRLGTERIGDNLPLRLAWAIGDGSIFSLLWDGTTTYSNDPKLLLIAKSDGNTGWIEACDKERQPQPILLDNNVHYRFNVEMSGWLEGPAYDLLRCVVICDLVYNKDKDEFKLKILERPTYTMDGIPTFREYYATKKN